MTFWLLVRASGLTAYVLLTASVLAGLVLKSKPFGRRLRAATVTDIHRFLALLGLGMLGLHAATILAELAYLSSYGATGLATGIASGLLMVLVTVSFSLRKWIGARMWRRLHWLTYLVFGLATVHGLAAGTDAWALPLYLGAVGSVAFATAWRALTPRGGHHVQGRDRRLAV
jgi:hypothetical protein